MLKYVIINNHDDNGKYVLSKSYIDKLLIKCDDEEKEYINNNYERFLNFQFAFNTVYLLKMACGHFELSQTHSYSVKEAEDWIKMMEEDARNHKCTRCICGW